MGLLGCHFYYTLFFTAAFYWVIIMYWSCFNIGFMLQFINCRFYAAVWSAHVSRVSLVLSGIQCLFYCFAVVCNSKLCSC